MTETVRQFMPYIVIFNFALVALVLIALAFVATRRKLSEVPDTIQNIAEYGRGVVCAAGPGHAT